MESPLEQLIGRTAAGSLLHILHHGQSHGSGIAGDLDLHLSAVQRQLHKLEGAGFLVSRRAGKTRVYQYDERSQAARGLKDLVELFYEGMPLDERQKVFRTRRRPRRRGKPIRNGPREPA